jgi:hypothetical protein
VLVVWDHQHRPHQILVKEEIVLQLLSQVEQKLLLTVAAELAHNLAVEILVVLVVVLVMLLPLVRVDLQLVPHIQELPVQHHQVVGDTLVVLVDPLPLKQVLEEVEELVALEVMEVLLQLVMVVLVFNFHQHSEVGVL